MTPTQHVLALLLLSALSGCSDTESGPEAATLDATTEDPVWRSTSERLELSTFSFFGGSMAYDITRDRLSAEQLATLEGLREIATPSGPLGADYASYSVRITDSSGEVSTFRAAQDNVIDSDEGTIGDARSIDYESLTPFLATLRCISAKEQAPSDPDSSASDPWASAATFDSDPACLNGVYVSSGDTHSYRKWQVDEAGSYRLSMAHCFQQTSLHLLDPAGETELSVSDSATAPDCPSLIYTFSEPGVYRVDLHKNQIPDEDRDTAGDMMLQVSRL